MGRLAIDPAVFLPALETGRAAVTAGETVNASGLARASGITWRLLERWIIADPAFPVLQRGRQGEPWRFDLVQALDYLIAYARGRASARAARGASAARLAGFGGDASGDVPALPDVPQPIGVSQDRAADARGLKALAEAQMTTHKLKQMQGEYFRADEGMALLADLMTTMQTETLAITAKLDPAGQWPADLRSQVEDELRTVLITVRDRLDATLATWGRRGGA